MGIVEAFQYWPGRGLALATALGLGLAAQASAGETFIEDLNPIHYGNRAECSLESEHPARSVFLIIDGYNAGKAAHSFATATRMDPNAVSLAGMKQFRLSLGRTALLIMTRLLEGNLPLLPMNLASDEPGPREYKRLVATCGEKIYCDDLEQYLSRIWSLSRTAGSGGSAWQAVDSFTPASFLKARAKRPGCFFIKRFSPIQGALHASVVSKKVLEELAQTVLERGKYVTACLDESDELDSRSSVLQLDLGVGEAFGAEWDRIGFDFWNSVRIYLSWAWRNAPEMGQHSDRFDFLFRSLALEESMMLVPNGCRSIIPPSCDSEYLSMNSLRELAKQGTKTEFDEFLPDGPDAELIKKGPRSVNDDFLGTRAYTGAAEWVSNFRKNLVQARGRTKMRFTQALRLLNVVFDTLTPEEILAAILSEKPGTDIPAAVRDEFHYLCTEYRLGFDSRLNILHSDLERIEKLVSLEKANDTTRRGTAELFGEFRRLSSYVLPVCDNLEKERFWDARGYAADRRGYSPWAKGLLQLESGEPPPRPSIRPHPLLVWSNAPGSDPKGVICASGIDCARQVLKAFVDLHAVSIYAEALLPISSNASAPAIFNPYSELRACKVYDPWFQTRRTQKRLVSDLVNTALFGWNHLPIYLDMDFAPGRVASFDKLMKDGKLRFDPRVDAGEIQASLLADFGPFLGAPCAIALNRGADKAFDFYAFAGISVNYCDGHTERTGTATGMRDVRPGAPMSRSVCGGCSLNFVGVASAASSGVTDSAFEFNPAKFAIYFFRAITRFTKGVSDPANVPRGFDADPNVVAETYRKHGGIPEKCVDQLGSGLKCFESKCAAQAARHIERTYGAEVSDVSLDFGNTDSELIRGDTAIAWMRSSLCDGQVVLRIQCVRDGESLTPLGNPWGTTRSCDRALVSERRK